MKTIYFILLFSLLGSLSLHAGDQTITLSGTSLDIGYIELLNNSDGTHSYTVDIGAGNAQTITVEAYKNDGSYTLSASWKVSLDGLNWHSSTSFVSSGSAETKTIYVRCSPTVDNSVNTQGLIVVADPSWDIYDEGTTTVTIKYPEMDITGSGNTVDDGSSSPVVTNNTDFGDVAVNSSKTNSFTITNSKGGPPVQKGKLFFELISAKYVTIGGANANQFSVTQDPVSGVLPGGGTTGFNVQFLPTTTGLKTATLTIYNNDQDENPYNFTIQGTGTAVVPTLDATSAVTARTSSGGTSGGNITADGGASVTERGVCWNTSTGPTAANSHSSDGTGSGSFVSTISGGLGAETKYYVRSYATNSVGTAYGPEVEFWTLSTEPSTHPGTVTVSDKGATSITLSWSAATGASGYTILYKAGATAPDATGVEDGKHYNNFTGIPVDVTVAGETTSTTFTVSGLSSSTQYAFTVISVKDNITDEATHNYKVDGTLSTVVGTTTVAAPTTQTSDLVWSGAEGSGSIEFSWTNGNGAGRIFLMKQGAACSNPSNGATYTGNTQFGSGSNLSDGTYVMFFGSGAKGNLVTTGLSDDVVYHFKVFEYNGVGSTTTYNTSEAGGFNEGNSSSSQLPIELLSFEAKLTDKGTVTIEWSTATELNNDYFTIERSTNLSDWETVTTLQGAGNSNEMLSYNTEDLEVPEGLVYYRLKQTDFDGKFTFSDMAVVRKSNSQNSNLQLSTTVVYNEVLSTQIHNMKNQNLKVEVINAAGQIALSKNFKASSNHQQVEINLSALVHGVYILRAQSENETKSLKFFW